MHREVLSQDRGGQLRGERQQRAASAGTDWKIKHLKPSSQLFGGDVGAMLATRHQPSVGLAALPPDIAQRAPFAQAWRAFEKALQAGIDQAAIKT